MANNKIQIKRSTTTAANSSTPILSNGELAFTANGNGLWIGLPDGTSNMRVGGQMVPGTLTANQALVANSTSGIDKVIAANLVTLQTLTANGGVGSSGQVLKSAGAGANAYWAQETAGVAGSNTQVQFNDSGSLAGAVGFTFDKTTNNVSMSNALSVTTSVSTNTFTSGAGYGQTLAGSTQNSSIIGVSSNTSVNSSVSSALVQVANSTASANHTALGFTAGISVVNTTVIAVGTNNFINSTALDIGNTIITTTNAVFGGTIAANGSIGSAGQVLTSSGAGNVYWTTPATGDITAVTAGDGLTGGGTSGDVTLNVGSGNGIAVDADSIRVNANSTGGLVANTTGLHVVAGSGLLSNATGLHVGTGNGMAIDADSIRVVAGNSQVVSNTSGVFIVESQINHDNLSGFVGNEHIDHSTVSITAGNGLSGGGDLTASRTLTVVAGDGLTVNSTGVHVGAANGISVAADTVGVTTGSTLTVNSTGIHVNNALSITDLTLSGNLTINGTLTTIDTTNLTVKDSMIELANGNGSTDSLDIGFYGQYGATGTKFTGIFRDATDGVYKLFSGLTVEPTTTVDTANLSYSIATLNAYLQSGGLVSNAGSVAITANSTVNVAIVANTLTLTTALATTSGGTGTGTYTSGDILVGNTGNALSKLSLGTSGFVLQSNGSALVYDTLDGGTF
jgi:hypothetical protein